MFTKRKKYIPHAEIPVVENCNLNCRLCNSHAYLIENNVYDFEQYKKDIDVLSKYMHFGLLTFMGGEPLLCKNLEEYIAYAKNKHIGEIYRVLSNGILVKKMSPDLMEIIDVLEISKYPEMKESVEEISDYLKPLSKKYHFTYYIKEINYFNEIDTISLLPNDAQRGYDNCRRISDGCSIFNGYYYKCMRPKTTNLYLERMHGIVCDKDMRIVDGVLISDDNFIERLNDYINRKERLEACNYCLMGLEKDTAVISSAKHRVYQYPLGIRIFYKSQLLYNAFKQCKKIFQYDEGAHTVGGRYVKTVIHEIK